VKFSLCISFLKWQHGQFISIVNAISDQALVVSFTSGLDRVFTSTSGNPAVSGNSASTADNHDEDHQ